MAVSTIKIKFTANLAIGAQLGFDVTSNGGPFGTPITYPLIFDFVNFRSLSNQVTVGTPTVIPGERSAINFVEAFNLDTAGGYTVTRTLNEVTIKEEVSSNATITYSVGGIFSNYINDPSLQFTINNATNDGFAVISKTFSTATSPCTHAKLIVNTNLLATKILSPIVVNPNTNNPFNFEVLRGTEFTLQLENINGTQINELIIAPSILNASNFSLQINNGPTGATVIVLNENTEGLTLQYSLDNVAWQTSETFSGLVFGDYTLYVKDNLGCAFSKPFHIDEFGILDPYFLLPKANSFRFANRITFGDSANYKNDENTLSCESDVQKAYKEIQQFQSADIITTQFRSNYRTNIAKVIKYDLSEVNIPIVKKTNNIGIKDKRDARKYNLENGKTGLYFAAGNVYDYTTNVISGTHALNGDLPEWAVIGNYFQIAGSWFLINDVVFDESKNANVIVFTNTYTGLELNVICGSIYNRQNYEVYEFSVDMVGYINQKFRIKLENTDLHFTTITHLSELIWCKVKHDEVLEIRYRNTTNTEILASTGIEHLIRIPYLKVSGKPDENSEVYKTDTDAILLNADLYEVDEFLFKPVTKEIWRKLMQALSHEKVLINGVGYVKNGNFSTDGPLDKSNLYVLTATMIKTGNVYNSQTSGNTDFNGSEVEIVGLISTDSGFVSY